VSASCFTSLSVFVPIFILHHEMCMSLSRHERCRLGVSVIRARYARVRTKEREDASWGYILQRACKKERTKENRWRKGEGGQKSVGGRSYTHTRACPILFATASERAAKTCCAVETATPARLTWRGQSHALICVSSASSGSVHHSTNATRVHSTHGVLNL